MVAELSETELNNIVQNWGMYRHDHPGYMYNLGRGHYLTWNDIGADIRHVYEKFGEWALSIELQKTYKDFDDFFWTDAENHMVQIKDVILSRIEYEPDIFNKDGFSNVLASKVIKSIAYGATWPQMNTFIEKEIARACHRSDDDERVRTRKAF